MMDWLADFVVRVLTTTIVIVNLWFGMHMFTGEDPSKWDIFILALMVSGWVAKEQI